MVGHGRPDAADTMLLTHDTSDVEMASCAERSALQPGVVGRSGAGEESAGGAGSRVAGGLSQIGATQSAGA
jgi:hypothetical protein